LLNRLGFDIIMETENVAGFSNQNFQVWLSKAIELEEPRVKREKPTGEELIVADHLAILVRDTKVVDAVEKDMQKNGFKALFPCEEYPDFCPGYYAVSFCNSDNYVIEIYTRPEPKRA
jgi:hypothetical protein